MIRYQSFKAEEIESLIDELGKLRIEIFRDFPYIYDGNLDYEREYLKTYSKAKSSLIFAAFDDSNMIGATSCIKLTEETDEVKAPFIEAGYDLKSIFYFGESILKNNYRGMGIGKLFFEEREAHALSFPCIKTTCFCAVKRQENHTLRPKDYKPLDEFWKKRQYEKREDLISEFEWKDIDEEHSSFKILEYWTKQIRP